MFLRTLLSSVFVLSFLYIPFGLAAQPKPEAPEELPAAASAQSPEQVKKLESLRRAFEAKVMPIQDKLDSKYLELRSMQYVTNVSHDDIKALVSDITTLRTQLRAEWLAFEQVLAKEGLAPQPQASAPGWNPNTTGGCAAGGQNTCPGCPVGSGPAVQADTPGTPADKSADTSSQPTTGN